MIYCDWVLWKYGWIEHYKRALIAPYIVTSRPLFHGVGGRNERFDYVFVGVTIFVSNFYPFPNAFLVWHLNSRLARDSTHLKLCETKIFSSTFILYNSSNNHEEPTLVVLHPKNLEDVHSSTSFFAQKSWRFGLQNGLGNLSHFVDFCREMRCSMSTSTYLTWNLSWA